MKRDAPKKVLYIMHKSLAEPIPRLHGLSQVRALAAERSFEVLSFEPAGGSSEREAAFARELGRLREAGVAHGSLRPAGNRWSDIARGALVIARSVLFRGTRIVHTRSYVPGFMAVLARPLLPFRHVFDMRGLFVDEYLLDGAFREGTPRLVFARWLERRVLASSDVVVVVSERFRRHVLEDPGLRGVVTPDVVHVIPNRARLERFERRPDDAEKGPGSRWVTGVYVGSDAGWHRFDVTARLMAGVMRARQDVRFIAAVYPDAARARQVALDAGVPDDRSRFVTRDPGDVPELLGEADFGLMLIEPHVSKEVSAPIKLAEYLASGLPVVAGGGIGDARDWIPDEKLGILIGLDDVPAAVDATLGFLSSEDFRSGAASRRARAFARRRLDMNETLREYERVYRRLEGR